MTLTTKILLVLLVMTVIGAAGFIWYKEKQMATEQADIQSSLVQMKQLSDQIARSQSSYVTSADLQAFAAQNKIDLSAIQSDIDKLGATVSGINNISVITKPQNNTNLPSSGTTPAPSPTTPVSPNSDPFGYLANTQHLTLNESYADNTIVPFGDISF